MTYRELINLVSTTTDTKGTAINVAITARVISQTFDLLALLPANECHDVIAQGLAAAAKRRLKHARKTVEKLTGKKLRSPDA